jgi:FHA domain
VISSRSPMSTLGDLLSSPLVESAMSRTQRSFLSNHGAALVLLVQVPQGDVELEQGLAASDAGSAIMPFRTEGQPLAKDDDDDARAAFLDQSAVLAKHLSGKRHFAIALRKRDDSDALFAERISVGRARNKDVVLRHPTVSKFHAWFEEGTDGALFVSDAESKNLTRVNGQALPPRVKTAVGGGDRVQFGSVECLLCSPSTLWAFLHPAVSVGAQGAR